MAQYPQDNSSYDSRPTLPPIRQWFRDELQVGRRPESPYESPPLTLSRLSVSDVNDGEYVGPSSRSSRRSPQHPPRTLYGLPSSSRHPHLSSQTQHTMDSRSSPFLVNAEYQPVSRQNTASPYNQVSRGSSYPTSLYSPLDTHASLSRSTSHHHMQGQPARFQPNNSIPQNYQRSDTLTETPYTYSGMPAPAMARHRSEANLTNPSPRLAWNISTEVSSATSVEDDERTPVSRYGKAPSRMEQLHIPHVDMDQLKLDEAIANATSRYECTYCGKGFNRPSSLRIHLNSHTGEKPFVCPVESCRRSFSVLSNMRRHARVHNTSLIPGSGELSLTAPSDAPASYSSSQGPLHRRGSSASSSNASVSRRSRSVSSDDLDDESHNDKRARRSGI